MYEKIYWERAVLQPRDSGSGALPPHGNDQRRFQGVRHDGWRLGYCGGPKEIIAAMSTIQGQSTSNDAAFREGRHCRAQLGSERASPR